MIFVSMHRFPTSPMKFLCMVRIPYSTTTFSTIFQIETERIGKKFLIHDFCFSIFERLTSWELLQDFSLEVFFTILLDLVLYSLATPKIPVFRVLSRVHPNVEAIVENICGFV